MTLTRSDTLHPAIEVRRARDGVCWVAYAFLPGEEVWTFAALKMDASEAYKEAHTWLRGRLGVEGLADLAPWTPPVPRPVAKPKPVPVVNEPRYTAPRGYVPARSRR